MGTWGHGLFDDDLALDVKASFDRAVAEGATPAVAAAGLMEGELAREVLEEFDDADRDDLFWEESRGLFYAVASLQLEHGVLQEVVRQQTLQALAVERRGLDPERDRARWELLDGLAAQLSRGADEAPGIRRVAAAAGVPDDTDGDDATDNAGATDDMTRVPLPRHQLAEGTNPALNIEQTMARRPTKRSGARKPPAARKPAPKKPAPKKPAPKKPAPKKPAPKKPAARNSAAGKPAAKKPAKKSAPKKPAPRKPAPKKPAKKAPARRGRKA
jgi:hypothetical protein